MASFHPNRSINLQKSGDQHGSLLLEPVYQPAKNRNHSAPFRLLRSLNRSKTVVINLASLHPNHYINLQKQTWSTHFFSQGPVSCDQHRNKSSVWTFLSSNKKATITVDPPIQGATKRCRLSWMTNSAIVFESQCGVMGGGGGVGSQPVSTAAHITMTWSPNKL